MHQLPHEEEEEEEAQGEEMEEEQSGTSEIHESQAGSKRRKVSEATHRAGSSGIDWSDLPRKEDIPPEWQTKTVTELLDMLFPGVGSVAKNCYKGRAQRELLARLLLKASQPPAVQQRVASTPQPSKEQGEEPFCGEPPLTLHVGRKLWLFSSEVALWIPQRKQFATLNSSEAKLGHLLCRLHDPHFFLNMTVVRAMTKEEEEQHRAIMSQVAQEREPENEKEKEQAKAQGPTDGGAGSSKEVGNAQEDALIKLGQEAFDLFKSQAHVPMESVEVLACGENVVTLNRTTQRIAFIFFGAPQPSPEAFLEYERLPAVFLHNQLTDYGKKLSLLPDGCPKARRLRWLAHHGIIQDTNQFEDMLPPIDRPDPVHYVTPLLQQKEMEQRYGSSPFFQEVKDMVDPQQASPRVVAAGLQEMLRNVWDWILSDVLVSLCGCSFVYQYESQWARYVWDRVFDWRHCTSINISPDMPFHVIPALYHGVSIQGHTTTKKKQDRRPDIQLCFSHNQDSGHFRHFFPFLFVEISAEPLDIIQIDHKDNKKLLIFMRLALEKEVLTLLQHVNNKQQFTNTLNELRVYGVLTAAWDMHLFAMQPTFDKDHNSIVYQWSQHPRVLDIRKAEDVVTAFELFERMSKISNYVQQFWQEMGPCRATRLSCYLPTFCEVSKGRATHAADTPTKAPKDKKDTRSKTDTSDGQSTGPGRSCGDRGKGRDKGHGKDSTEGRKGWGGGKEVQDAGFIPSSDSPALQPEASALLEMQSLIPAELLAEIHGWVPKGRKTWVSKGPGGKVAILKCRKKLNQEMALLRKVTPHPNLPTLHFSAARRLQDGRHAYLMVQNRLVGMQEAAVGPASGAVCALACAVDIMQAMLHLHSHDICHQDIKPGNIMWDPTTRHWVLLDLDSGTIAPAEEEEGKGGRKKRNRASPPPRLMSRKHVGTRGFMAPEVNACFGLEEYDAFLADTWSFGRSMQAVFMEQTRVLPHRSMPALSKLLEEATHPQPHRRPSLHEALPKLQELLRHLQR